MRFKLHILHNAMISMALFFIFSCKEKKDYSKDLETLNSLSATLHHRIDTVKILLMDSLPIFQDSAQMRIDLIQNFYNKEMPEETAELISNYHQTLSKCTDPEANALSILQELVVCKNQIDSLHSLISRGADHDALGNEITPIYLEEALKAEKKRTEPILSISSRFILDYQDAIGNYKQYNDRISAITSQLK